jgi:hypothetical protein
MQKALTTTRPKQFTLFILTTICILTDKLQELVVTTTLLQTGINNYYAVRSQRKSWNNRNMTLIFLDTGEDQLD